MPISSVSSNEWLKVLPPQPVRTNTPSEQDSAPSRDMLELSNKAKLISQQRQSQPDNKQDDTSQNQESVQVSSSIGKATTATGLSRDEAIAMYRSIESMMT